MFQVRSLRAVLVAAAMLAALAAGCSSSGDDGGQAGAASDSGSGGGGDVYKLTQQLDMSIEVSSTKFNETRRIPRTYSCERDDISPPIDWSGVPDGTVSLALLVDSDQLVREERPDLVWVHWMLWNIPPDASGVPENVPKTAAAPSIGPNAGQGTNDEQNIGWSGPCKAGLGIGWTAGSNLRQKQSQAVGQYYFRLYALDTELQLGSDATKNEFLRAIDGHVLAGRRGDRRVRRPGQADGVGHENSGVPAGRRPNAGRPTIGPGGIDAAG